MNMNFLTYYLNSSTSVLKSLVFQIVGESHQWSLYLRMLGKGLLLNKTTALIVFFLWLVKSLKNLEIIGLLITWRNVAFFLIFSMVLGLLNQLQIFWHLYLIELLGLLTGLGLLELWHLIYPRLLTGFGMLVFFTNLSLMEFQVRYLALFLLFSVIDGFKWFWMGSLHKNIQLMLEFLKASFFSYYTWMTFLMMLSVILLSMLIMLHSTLSVIRHLISGNN